MTASEPKKTGWEPMGWLGCLQRPKYQIAIATLTLIVTVCLVAWSLWSSSRQNDVLNLNGHSIMLERVSTSDAMQRGLSGRVSLPDDHGMLFMFDETGSHCFWMKDMYFNIDMIWLDENKRVVTLKRNAAPASYPESFCPDKPAKYVLEVKAGVTDKAGLALGTQLNF